MTRRSWLTACGFALAASCARPKRIGFPGYALVATAGDQTVTAVDLTRFQIVRSIPVSGSPTMIAPGPHGTSYVLTPQTGSIHLIDNDLNVASSRHLAGQLAGLESASAAGNLWTTTPATRELLEVNSAGLEVVRRHKLSAEPTAIDVTSIGRVAVAGARDGVVELFSPESSRPFRAQFPGRIGEVRFRSDGKLLLVANYHDRSLTVLSVPDLEIVADLPLAMQPQNLCFSVDRGQLFVSGEGMDAVAIVFPFDMLEVEQTVLAGRNPGVMACSGTPAYLFVASADGSDVCILNIETRKVFGIVEVGQGPDFIRVTPDSRFALILDRTSGDLAVIYIPGIRQNPLRTDRYKTGGALFTLLPVGNTPVHLAVVPKLA